MGEKRNAYRLWWESQREKTTRKTLHPVPGGYKYGDLALQVGGVSDETVKYGREFCGTSTQE
jgi:hypothetical protein